MMLSPQSLLAHADSGALWPTDAATLTDVAAAYQSALAVRALRGARGERPVGYKVGFTNRGIWARYDVDAPIWGTVWDTTLATLDTDAPAQVALAGICQPRLEPVIVFGIRETPPLEPTLEQMFNSVDWLAPGFEIVQSHRPDWKFSAADTVADGALHARLIVGRTLPVRALADSGAELDERLGSCRVRLARDGTPVEDGVGSAVLDGPLHALHHFVFELQRCPGAPALLPGDVVTTGTWTDAWPMQPGQTWAAVFELPIGEITLVTA